MLTLASEYPALSKHLDSILDAPPTMIHLDLEPQSPRFFSPTVSGALEIITIYFDQAHLPTTMQHDFTERVRKFLLVLQEHASPGFKGSAKGFSNEHDLVNPKTQGKGQVFMVVIGWESIDVHMKFRETDQFKSAIKDMQSDAMKGITMQHIHPEDFMVGTGGTGAMPGDAQDEILNPQGNKGVAPEARKDGSTKRSN